MMNKMPVIFVGHGSPMNAIDDNEYSRAWAMLGSRIGRPEAILSLSAHWYTNGTRITDDPEPKQIYDMYGFPEELYQVEYPAKGSPEIAHHAMNLIGHSVSIDNTWGIDHGTWSVLCRMFPDADIPVIQMSIDSYSDAETHYEIGKKLAALRERGILILGSGNIVHNLMRIEWDMNGGQPWATEFDRYIRENILSRNHQEIICYEHAGPSAKLAVPTPDHFYPLLYVLSATGPNDKVTVFNDSCTLGSLSMTSYLFE